MVLVLKLCACVSKAIPLHVKQGGTGGICRPTHTEEQNKDCLRVLVYIVCTGHKQAKYLRQHLHPESQVRNLLSL